MPNMPSEHHVADLAAVLALCIAVVLVPVCATAQQSVANDTAATRRSPALALVEEQVRGLFPDVAHMSTADLERHIAEAPDRLVLLDVRSLDEQAVSWIAGATRIPPATRSAAVIAERAGGLEGRLVVAYCSIGLRSSRLLVRIGQSLKEKGAAGLYNLDGGLFRWRNDGRPLVTSTGPTRAVHPHSVLWRTFLLDDPQFILPAPPTVPVLRD